MKILFLTLYPKEDPAVRYRFLQYFDLLKKEGIRLLHKTFLSSFLYRTKNKRGLLLSFLKFILVIWSSIKRLVDIFIFVPFSDIVIIHKEAFPFGPPCFERLIKFLNKNIVFDFDDAIFAYPKELLGWRKIWYDAKKPGKICKMAKVITVGNEFLEDYALKFNKNVEIIPTGVDLKKYTPKMDFKEKSPIIGWIGTISNIRYLNIIKEALEHLAKSYDFILKLVGPEGIYDIKFKGVKTEYKIWKLEEEIQDIKTFDIGLMPLENTIWEKGKCGFKAIQYMACGIPAIVSPVGVNKKIIQDGQNGFLASSTKEWQEKLRTLIEDVELRKRLGEKGREVVKKSYSKEIIFSKLFKVIKATK